MTKEQAQQLEMLHDDVVSSKGRLVSAQAEFDRAEARFANELAKQQQAQRTGKGTT